MQLGTTYHTGGLGSGQGIHVQKGIFGQLNSHDKDLQDSHESHTVLVLGRDSQAPLIIVGDCVIAFTVAAQNQQPRQCQKQRARILSNPASTAAGTLILWGLGPLREVHPDKLKR